MDSEKKPLLSGINGINSNDANSPSRFASVVHKVVGKLINGWKRLISALHLRQCLAEFLGTFLLVTIGNASIAQKVLSKPNGTAFGTFQSINIGYALGLVIGVHASIGVSGAHLNPAVTWAMALRKKVPWLMVVPYWIAQYLGAFISSFVLYWVYIDGLRDASCGFKEPNCTAGIFATYPLPYLSLANGFLDQVFGTFILLIGIFAVCDSNNSEPKAGLKPFLLGVILWAVGTAFGMNCGYAINPARDLGPRIFTAMAGWGKDVFVCSFCGKIRHWWWVPVVAPMVGATIAAFVYWCLIEVHHPKNQDRGSRNEQANDLPRVSTPTEEY